MNSDGSGMEPFTTYLRVRRYEMDVHGHVNNAVYQHYLEQAAIEHSESLGFTAALYEKLGGTFVMRRITIDYLRPAFAGDTLALTTWLQEMRGSRALRRYEIRRSSESERESDLIVTAEALWVWVDIQTMRPRAIPDQILETYGLLTSQNQGRKSQQIKQQIQEVN
ncbi:acyl-CoA thioesterase [Leptolyngbya sp. 7M]|uniref:acyl-CoA thioesterase n=1 Tax=Leptolyngbya sp. 7M TaxID=2812896 RepID=UPI001B8AE65C|nr:thioesterase family protein [Leptolyngbya sp. 7M]QYO63184.1 acyl-CoA thioesterase [Leptolyngbya sp. 7M]